jgi:dTDP-4-amino-4,6-dideoxygalactose transaminase
VTNLANMLGFNFRLGEIECAIGIEQLKKLKGFVTSRQNAAHKLTQGLAGLIGLKTPSIQTDCTHVYYVYPLQLDVKQLGVSRSQVVKALESEGLVGLAGGYANVHLLPIYQQKIAYGSKGFPWSSDICRREVSYAKGICPVAETLHDSTYFGFEMCLHQLSDQEVDAIVLAFRKVWANMGLLKSS